MTPADAVLLMSSVPERISDLVYGLDEARLRYRHGPAFPTLGGLIVHLLDSGTKVDALLRHAHLDGLATADVRATIDPGLDQGRSTGRCRRRSRTSPASAGGRSTCSTAGARASGSACISDPRGGDVTLLDICRHGHQHEMAHIAQIRNLTVLLPEPEDLGTRTTPSGQVARVGLRRTTTSRGSPRRRKRRPRRRRPPEPGRGRSASASQAGPRAARSSTGWSSARPTTSARRASTASRSRA